MTAASGAEYREVSGVGSISFDWSNIHQRRRACAIVLRRQNRGAQKRLCIDLTNPQEAH